MRGAFNRVGEGGLKDSQQAQSWLHGCTKLLNLEMEPKCLTKSDIQLIPDISRTKNDKRIYTVKSTKTTNVS